MKKFLKKAKGVFAVGLAAVLLSTSAVATEDYDSVLPDYLQSDESGGTLNYNVATGEVTYTPASETESYSNETEGFSPGYDPFANEDDDSENSIQPYMADNRVKVNNPQNDGRCRNTVYIEVTLQSGKVISGSGFMIGPNAVATCGHLVCDDGFGEDGKSWSWAKSAKVYPALNTGTNQAPYGFAYSTNFICGRDWAKNLNFEDDWGIIILDSNIGNKVGWLGLRWQSDSYNGEHIMVNGYPNIKGNSWDMYMCRGTISASYPKLLYSKNAYISQGNSGGPCYIDSNETGYTAIGISSHHPWNSDDAVFCRITETVFNEFIKYRVSTL